jgi:hypothetical protein
VAIEAIELQFYEVGPLEETVNGNRYVVCQTNRGSVQVWGSDGNMTNINDLQDRHTPFTARCGCIPSKWAQHDLWVPQTTPIEFL